MKKILVALDHSPRASEVLARAAALAAHTKGAELFLFRAVSLPPELSPDAFRTSPDDVVENMRAMSVSELERLGAALDPTIVTHVLVRIGSPWSAICASAKEHDVDLIVLGSHGYDVIDRVVGTTAAKVVNHADRSVLVVRAAPRAL